MRHKKDKIHKKAIIRYTKELERRIFFYATIVMFLLYCLSCVLGD